ncbi:MAG: hypothetical protein FJ279_21005 [Planctomycetes bacterium]|nr:hypothetical protein [Planctomycetota bacterium]
MSVSLIAVSLLAVAWMAASVAHIPRTEDAGSVLASHAAFLRRPHLCKPGLAQMRATLDRCDVNPVRAAYVAATVQSWVSVIVSLLLLLGGGSAHADSDKGEVIRCQVLASSEGWTSAGAYAIAGKPLSVQARGHWSVGGRHPQVVGPEGRSAKFGPFRSGALIMQIGCQTDNLSKEDHLKREPVIVERHEVGQMLSLTPKHGGLIYFYVNDRSREGNSGRMSVTIQGAVAAPVVRKHEIAVTAYRQLLEKTEALWGELEGDYIIHCLPVERMKRVQDPDALMDWYDRLYLAYCDLDGRRPSMRKTRYVPDVQISVGGMHSGNPIMYQMRLVDRVVNMDRIRFNAWGAMHELGHNFQRQVYRLAETPEVDANIFTLYGIHTLKLRDHAPLADVYVAGLRTFEQPDCFQEWTEKPFLGLAFYYELVRGFGWEPFKKLFRAYSDVPAKEHPKTYEAKRDLFFTLMSKFTNRNLDPFFKRWGVPVSDQALRTAKGLSPWAGAYPKAGGAQVGIDMYHAEGILDQALAEFLDSGLECRLIMQPYDRDGLVGLKLLLFEDPRFEVHATAQEAPVLAEWVDGGGVALFCCSGWAAKTYGKMEPEQLNANVLVRPFGLFFSGARLANQRQSDETREMAKNLGLREGSAFDSATIARHSLTNGVGRIGLPAIPGVIEAKQGEVLVWGEDDKGTKLPLLALVPRGRGWVAAFPVGLFDREFFWTGYKLGCFDNSKLWINMMQQFGVTARDTR